MFHAKEKLASSARSSVIQKLLLETTFALQSAAEVLNVRICAHKYFWIIEIITLCLIGFACLHFMLPKKATEQMALSVFH